MQQKGRENGQCHCASVASFNTSFCSLGQHSCPIKNILFLSLYNVSLFHCDVLSVCLGLVKIYFYQMLSALLTPVHLFRCTLAPFNTICRAEYEVNNSRGYPQLCVVSSTPLRLQPNTALVCALLTHCFKLFNYLILQYIRGGLVSHMLHPLTLDKSEKVHFPERQVTSALLRPTVSCICCKL